MISSPLKSAHPVAVCVCVFVSVRVCVYVRAHLHNLTVYWMYTSTLHTQVRDVFHSPTTGRM